jgi:heme-degrading monooxygenase HmoA
MVYEIAEIQVTAGHEREFEAAVRQAVPLFKRAAGCRGMNLQRVIEVPDKYRLVVQWDTVEHHMVQFRGSPDFQEWRRLVGGHMVTPPVVDHTAVVVEGF